jgi:hypothetical protein
LESGRRDDVFRANDPAQLGSNEITVTFTFTNSGERSTAIEDVTLIQITGENAEIDRCSEIIVRYQWQSFQLNPKSGNRFKMHMQVPGILGRDEPAPKDAPDITFYRPVKVIAGDKISPSSSLNLETNSTKLLVATFKPEAINLNKTPLIHCFAISYFTGKGDPITGIHQAWTISRGVDGMTVHNPVMDFDAVRLLPVDSAEGFLKKVEGQYIY